MKPSKHRIFTFILAFFVAAWGLYAQGSQLDAFGQNSPRQEKYRFEASLEKRFQVELFGGWASMNAADLNLRPAYDTQYLINLRDYYSSYYPDIPQSSPEGDFKTVDSSLPFGLRVRYRLSPLISFSLGLKYSSKKQTSEVSAEFTASGRRPHDLQYIFTDYAISTKAWVPTLGVHLSFGGFRSWDFEYFLAGGPMFAGCRYLIISDQAYSRYGSVYRMYETDYDAEGKSTGVSLETGLRINIKVRGGLKAFCEGGYAYQKAKNLKGPGNFVHYYYRDPNTKETSDNLYWEGYWGVKETEEFPPLPSNEWEKDDERVREFTLDLSGAFIRFGLSLSFSL